MLAKHWPSVPNLGDMSARDDYPLHRALEMLNGGPSALDEIDQLRALRDALEVIARPSRVMNHDEIVEQCSAANLLHDWQRGAL